MSNELLLASEPHVSTGGNESASKHPLEKKSELWLRANDVSREKAMKSRKRIADTLERRTELLKEKNAVPAYAHEGRETPEDLSGRTQFFELSTVST